MTQVASPSSRRSRREREQDARHATHHHPAAAPIGDGGQRGRHATTRGQNFSRIMGWTVLGALIPGAGLIAVGRRVLGGVVLVLSALVVLGVAGLALTLNTARIARLVTDPNQLFMIVVALGILLVAWATVVLGTHASARRYGHLTSGQRTLASLLVTSLIAVVALPTVKSAWDVMLAKDVLTSVFKVKATPVSKQAKRPDTAMADPWAKVPRVNVMLMGGDSGTDRTGVRADTMIVASIDTHTGNTVLVSLPRNLQHVPFPPGSPQALAYPSGFYCYNASAGTNTECLLNALWTWGVNNASLYYKGDPNPGLTATVEGVEQVTGLRIDDYVMLNLRGFEQFIDAMGGLTINVQEKLPVGGSVEHPVASVWLKPGRQRLDGYYALWYARSRWSTDDYDRMRRQRCVIGAVVQQANPVQLAIQFPDVAAAMKQNLATSIPLKDVQAWVTLALRVKRAHVLSLAFTNSIIDTANPDFAKMRQLVANAINPPAPTASATHSSTATGSGTSSTTRHSSSTKHPVETGAAQDVAAVC